MDVSCLATLYSSIHPSMFCCFCGVESHIVQLLWGNPKVLPDQLGKLVLDSMWPLKLVLPNCLHNNECMFVWVYECMYKEHPLMSCMSGCSLYLHVCCVHTAATTECKIVISPLRCFIKDSETFVFLAKYLENVWMDWNKVFRTCWQWAKE